MSPRSGAHRLADRLVRLVGFGALKVVDDTGDQQRAQVTINAGGPDGVQEVIDHAVRLGEYGFNSCPPEGSEAVILFLGGRRSIGVIIATGYRAARPKGLKPGEAMVFNAVTGDFIELSEDGKIRSQTVDWIHDGDQHVSGSAYAAHMIPADGWTGTFATGDSRTVHVTHGIITDVT